MKGKTGIHLHKVLVFCEDEGQQGVVPKGAESLEDAPTLKASSRVQSERHNGQQDGLLVHMVAQHEAA